MGANVWRAVSQLQLLTVGIGVMLTYGAAIRALATPLVVPPGFVGDPSTLFNDQIEVARKIQYAFLMMHPLALSCTRASFLLLYRRIFDVNKSSKIINGTIVMVVCWAISFFFAELFQCNTLWEANWSSTHNFAHKCNKTLLIVFAVCLSGFIIDLTILLIPIPIVWKLRLSPRKKIGVIFIFLLGSGTVVASMLRLILLTPPIFGNTPSQQRFITLTTSVYFGMVEAGVAIFVACLPTLQMPLRAWIWGKPVATTAGTAGSSGGRTGSMPNMFGYRSWRRAGSQADPTIDAANENMDSNPILSVSESWVYHNNRSEEGAHDIEMRLSRPKAAQVEVDARSAY
jgi:hypothetical protein